MKFSEFDTHPNMAPCALIILALLAGIQENTKQRNRSARHTRNRDHSPRVQWYAHTPPA